MDKPLEDMTNDELKDEFQKWDDKIVIAQGWGAAVAAAIDFRSNAAREMARRNIADAYALSCRRKPD